MNISIVVVKAVIRRVNVGRLGSFSIYSFAHFRIVEAIRRRNTLKRRVFVSRFRAMWFGRGSLV